MLLVAAISAAHGAPVPLFGFEWRPLSRQDLAWVEESRTSGLAVGEHDGTVRPALQAFGGAWFSDRVALTASLGVARLTNNTDLDDIARQRHWGVIRPAFDLRWAFGGRRPERALPYLLAGLHGDIPSVRDVSNGYTKKEQEAADENELIEKARIAGVGARLGIGATYPLTPGLWVGGHYTVGWHRALFQADDLSVATQWLAGEAALVVAFEWPGKRREQAAAE